VFTANQGYGAAASSPPPAFPANQGHGAGSPPPPAYAPPLAYGAPPTYTATHLPAPARNDQRRLYLIIAAVVAVVVVVITVVIVAVSSGGSTDTDTPKAAAKAYLDALARGDAKTALSLGKDQPGSTELLTDDVLKQQIAKWPITDIQILNDGSPMGNFATVHVSAKFGSQVSDAQLSMHKTDGWKLDTATVKIDNSSMSSMNKALKTLTVFGKTADNPVYVFPGWVDFASSNSNLTITGKPPLLAGLSSYASGLNADSTIELSDDGTKAIMSQLTDGLAKCTASNLLAPPGCPLKAQPYGLLDGTARWGGFNDLNGVKLTFNPYDMTVLVLGQVKTTFTASTTSGGINTGTITGFINAKADVSDSPPTLTYG
jgi:hypothetical protein